MSRPERAPWLVSGSVDAPIEDVWQALLAGNTDLSPADRAAIAARRGPEPFSTRVTRPPGGTVRLQVDPEHRWIAVTGIWWYRGVWSVEERTQGSRLDYRVYNIAWGNAWWLARVIHAPGHARRMRVQMQAQLRAIAARLGCTARSIVG